MEICLNEGESTYSKDGIFISTMDKGGRAHPVAPERENNTITIKLHYSRSAGDYAGWNAWIWTVVQGGRRFELTGENGEMVATMTVDGRYSNHVSYIIRKGEWEEQEYGERRIDISTVACGTVHCFVTSGKEEAKTVLGDDAVITNKILAAELDYDDGTIRVRTAQPYTGDAAKAITIFDATGADKNIAITEVAADGCAFTLKLNKTLELTTLYRYRLGFEGYRTPIKTTTVYAARRFNERFTYTGKDLGCAWTKIGTTFKVWAPTAEKLEVAVYNSGTAGTNDQISRTPMVRGEKGVWSVHIGGDLNGRYYTYLVTVNGQQAEAVDPYARTTGVNGRRGMILNLSTTNPKGWDKDCNPNPLASYTDAVLYETHVRDFSIDKSSGVSKEHRGKFLAFTESGTTTPGGSPTCLDYLKTTGITHLHLLPVYDYGSVDESKLNVPQYNWGYDPVNYNVPEGSYSTDPYHGQVRVREMKQMMKAIHDAGISVVMDVVYNHVYEAGTFCFNQLVPGYFSRSHADGSWSNGSGCGNDTASERPMVRKYIVDSIVYWADEYHFDGFRFDLVGLLDTATINALVDAVHAKRPGTIFYGEGWTLPTAVEPGNHMATQPNAHMTPEFAYFSDTIRNLVAGENGRTTGFASGLKGKEDPLFHCFTADVWWCPRPTQSVNYVSCHDNYSLMDKLAISRPDASREDWVKMNKLAAAICLTAQGIPFMQAGEEFLREKFDKNGKRVENSYNAPDSVNAIRWSDLDKPENKAAREYYRGLVAFRKCHPALRLTTKEAVAQAVRYRWITNEVVLFEIRGKSVVPGECADGIVVMFNATNAQQSVDLRAAGVASGRWRVCINDRRAGIEPFANVVDDRVTLAPVSAMVLVKGMAHCRHSYKKGVCTHCGAGKPVQPKQKILSRLRSKNR